MAPEKPTDDSRLRQTSGGSEDKTPNGGYAKTSMIVRIELPALSKATQVHFALEPSKSKRVLDGLAEFVRDIPRQWNDELLDLDTDSSETQLEVLRQEVLVDLDSWNMKVKAAEEWKRKVDHAAANMNKMRDAYYRELFHLREQVYRQDKANKEGTAFLPTYALHFDPSEYHVEDEVRLAVAAKVALLEQEFQTKHDEQEVKHGARVRSLNEQLVVSKMSLSRKDKLLEKLKLKHGWDNQQLKDMLEAQKIDEEKLRAKIEAKAQQAEQLAAVAFKELSSKQDSAEDVNDEVQKLRGFLERKHGSIKDAIVQIKLTSDVDARMGLAEFQKWAEQISYVTETKRAFVHLCGASPFTSLRDIFDRLARPAPVIGSSTGGAMTRRRSAAAELEGVRRNLTESHDPGVSLEPAATARRRSIDGAIDVSASRMRRALGRRHSMGSLGKIVEGEQITMDTAMSLTAGSAIGSDSDSDLMSDAGSELSDFSECASRVSGTKSDTSHRMPKVLGRAGSNIGLKSMVSCEVATDVSLASGIEAAFSSTNSLLKRDTADAGCDARPYEASFGKRPLKTRAVQSQIDRTMLESAIQVITAVGVESLDEARQSYASGVATSRSAARARSPRGSSRTASVDLDAAGLEADDGAGAAGVVDEDPPPSPTTSAMSPKRRKAAARAAPSAAGDGGEARQTGEGAEPEEGPEAEEGAEAPSAGSKAVDERGRAPPPPREPRAAPPAERHRRLEGLEDRARASAGAAEAEAAAVGPADERGGTRAHPGEPGAPRGGERGKEEKEDAGECPSAVSTASGPGGGERSTFGSGAAPWGRACAADAAAQAQPPDGAFGAAAPPRSPPRASGAAPGRADAATSPERSDGDALAAGGARTLARCAPDGADGDPAGAPADRTPPTLAGQGAARPGPASSSEAASPRWAGASRDADLGAPSDEPPPGRHTFGGALGARREPQAELRTTFINADDLPVGSGPERTLAGTTYRKIRAGMTDPGREFVTDHILGLSGPALPKRTPGSRSATDSQMQAQEGDADGGRPSLQRTVALTARKREGVDSCPVQRLAQGAKRRVCPSEQAGASASELREGSEQDDDAALAPGWSGLVPRVSFSSRMVETARQISPGTERQASPGIERQASVDGVEDLLGAGVLGSARTSSPPSRQICRNLAARGVRKVPSKEVLLDAEAGGPAERRTEPALRSARTMPLERGRPAASMAFARGLASPGRAADAGGDAGGDAGSDCDSLPDTGCVVDLLLERPHAKVPRGVLPAEPICSPRVRRLRGMPSGSSSAAFSRPDSGGSLLPPMASQMLDLPDSAGVECRVSATTPSSGPMSARVSFRRTVGNVFYRPEKQQPDAGKTSRTALPEVSRLKRMASAEKLDAGPSPPLALASARQRAVAEDPADLPQRATFHGVFPVREPAVSRRPPGSSSDFRQSRGKMLFDASR